MSLVGTRPPTVDEWDKYELHHRARLATKPGLTGMWQVSGRSNITDLYFLTIVPMLVFLFKNWRAHEIGTVKFASIIGTNLLYLQSWIPSEDYYWALNGVTWFLSDLLFCYLTIFIFFWIIRRMGSKLTLVMLFLIEFAWEFLVLNCFQNQTAFLTYIFPVCRALDFGIGISLGVLSKCKEKKNLNGMLVLSLDVYVVMMVVFNKKLTYSVYHVIETLLVWTVVMNSGNVSKFIFENPLLVKIGNISEVIFLTHLPVIAYMRIIWEKMVGNQYRFVEWIVILLCIFVTAYGVSYIQKMIQGKDLLPMWNYYSKNQRWITLISVSVRLIFVTEKQSINYLRKNIQTWL